MSKNHYILSLFSKRTLLSSNKNSEFKTTLRLVLFTSGLFLALLLWQAHSSTNAQHQYHQEMMKSVTDRVLTDYQEYLTQLRLEIDLFQEKHKQEIIDLTSAADQATKEEYMPLYRSLKKDIKHTRLFAIIDAQGNGILKHITGDFLPACKEEVSTTLKQGTQESLFLHHSKTSVHFDLLQPLIDQEQNDQYFFTAFDPDRLEDLLSKYQLPHQQLFLMRADELGKIELTTESDNSAFKTMTIDADTMSSFSYVAEIPRTRWQLAIRLDPGFESKMHKEGILKALGIWLLLTAFIYLFYRMQKSKILKQERIESALMHQGQHDRLTGLANREQFDSKLSELIAAKANNGDVESEDYGAVIQLDIDKFQVINNTYGYGTGDKVLYQLSIALRELLPDDATLCRLGNDEFAIIFPTLYHSASKSYSDKLRQFIQSVDITHINADAKITACVGVINIDNELVETEQILSSLHLCVAVAKQKGRNRVQVYQSDDQQLQQHANEMHVVHQLSEAIANDKLILFRQEIRPLAVQGRKHFEVLMRIEGDNQRIITPGVLIPAAEKHGLSTKLDQAIIARTFEGLIASPDDDASYSINLSGATITDQDTANFIEKLIIKYDIDPSRLYFEITETAAIAHIDSAIQFIERLTRMGCRFALDDFGSGTSSFSYLQQLPISVIKIDGAFVKDIDKNSINHIFVESIQRTAVAMNKKTVAEFVENAEIVDELKKIGIDYAQGYHIHKPEHWF